METLKFLWRHRTKMLGFAQVVVGSVQTNLILFQGVITPLAFAIANTVIGAMIVAVGFFNSRRGPDDPVRGEAPP